MCQSRTYSLFFLLLKSVSTAYLKLQLCIKGRHVFMGYLNNEEKSKESLDETGWLHTGDIGKIDKVGTAKYEKSFHFHGHTLGFRPQTQI